ncbi:MAG: hypothetical protein Q8K32_11245 [Archangium sp.]|nr:hypothetical protein [Archangium sp.]
MKWLLAVLVFASCVTVPPPLPPTQEDAGVVMPGPVDDQAALRTVVQRFVLAAEAGRFEEVLSLLARPLRERYSVELLTRDFGTDPLASARLSQIKLKATGPFTETKDIASVEWASGRSLRLVREPEGWRISSLE